MQLVDQKDDILHTEAKTIDFDNIPEELGDLKEFGDRMLMHMREFGGIGLAAPQIGYGYKIFTMHVNLPKVVINPIFSPVGEEMVKNYEGCLSYPGLSLKVKRHLNINVQYQDVHGKTIVETLSGLESRCFQHETDHLNGICFVKRVSQVELRIARSKAKKLV